MGTTDAYATRQMDVGHDRRPLQDAEEDDEKRALLHPISVQT